MRAKILKLFNKRTEFLRKLSYVYLNVTQGKPYRMVLQQKQYKAKKNPAGGDFSPKFDLKLRFV